MHIHRISFNRVLVSILVILSLSSCKSTPSSSSKVIGGDITTDYPYVIKIIAKDYSVEDFQVPDDEDPICGSAAVSPTTLITASHCITDPSAEYNKTQKPILIRYYKKIEIQVNGKKYTTNKLKWNPKYEKVILENQNNSMYDDLKRPFDIAVIVFDDAPFKDIPLASISTDYPASGTPVRLIGYGPNSWEKELNKSTPLTTGTNFTSQTSFCHKGTVEVRSKIDENLPNYLDRPTLQVGDSGGPLLIEGTSKVIGIASGHADSEKSGYASACYASPALKENVEFLKSSVKSIGADIPGIDKL